MAASRRKDTGHCRVQEGGWCHDPHSCPHCAHLHTAQRRCHQRDHSQGKSTSKYFRPGSRIKLQDVIGVCMMLGLQRDCNQKLRRTPAFGSTVVLIEMGWMRAQCPQKLYCERCDTNPLIVDGAHSLSCNARGIATFSTNRGTRWQFPTYLWLLNTGSHGACHQACGACQVPG